jgi:DNA-binding IclR family transcriptional regulator
VPSGSNPTGRVIAIIDHLIRSPSQPFTLSELARAVGVSKTTCLAIVTELVGNGYLLRHPSRRTYTLGPSLIAAGQAAALRFPDMGPALPAMEELAEATSAQCVAMAAIDDQLVVVAAVGHDDPLHGLPRLGIRVPFVPPYGASLIGWAGPGAFEDWVRRADPALAPDEVDTLRDVLVTGRQRGFVVSAEIDPGNSLRPALVDMRHAARAVDYAVLSQLLASRLNEAGYFLREVKTRSTYSVNNVAAPIRRSPSEVPVALLLPLFGWRMKGREVLELGQAVAATADTVARLLSRPRG